MKRTSIQILIASALFAGCAHIHEHENHDHGHEVEYEEETEENLVHIDSARMTALGISTAAADTLPFAKTVNLAGILEVAAEDASWITAPAEGSVRISKNMINGAIVSAGEYLATIAPTTSQATEPKQTAAALNAAKREYDRISSLAKEHLATTAELEQARAAYEVARAAHSQQASSGRITSPMSGTIDNISVTNGQYVTAGQPIARVIRSNDVALTAEIPERIANSLQLIGEIFVKPSGGYPPFTLNRKEFRQLIGNSSAATGYRTATIIFKNPGIDAAKISTELYLRTDTESKIALPADALVEDQGSYFVYVSPEPNHFERRMVKPGDFDGERYSIESGIAPGEIVAVSGAPMIRMAENANAPAPGHTH